MISLDQRQTVLVHLEDDEEAHALRMLRESDGHPDWMVGRDPSWRRDGWRAEVAVAAWLGLRLERLHAGPDGGVDLALPFGSLQVKFNHYADGDLYTPHYDPELHADMAVLVRPHGRDLRVGGWIDRATFTAQAHRLRWQRRPQDGGPGLTPAELWPIDRLEAMWITCG